METSRPRSPVWSGAFTHSLAARVPHRRRAVAVTGIKMIHTAIFLSVSAAILLALGDGLRGRPRRRTALAGGLVLAETTVFLSNNMVCPLTPLAEELGAQSGSVTNIFLPDWFAQRIPLFAGSTAILALVLNIRAWRSRSDAASGASSGR